MNFWDPHKELFLIQAIMRSTQPTQQTKNNDDQDEQNQQA